MKLILMNQDTSIAATGETPLAHERTMAGAVYRYGDRDYVVTSRIFGAPQITAVETIPMVLDGDNFTVDG